MDNYLRIIGQKRLEGEVNISGSKNLCVALIPASLLSRDVVTLYDIPPISDVTRLINILKLLNVKVDYQGTTLKIDSRSIAYHDLDLDEMSDLRASYYFYSVMIGMFNYLKARKAGGCKFGERPVNLHLEAFEKMGVKYKRYENHYEFRCDVLNSDIITFPKPSVGASINVAMLAVLTKGVTIIKNISIEPEVKGLIRFLKKMGADIEWTKSREITINGGKPLHGCSFKNIKDRIESGTYALIGAAIGKNMRINGFNIHHNKALLNVFNQVHVSYVTKNNTIILNSSIPQGTITIKTAPYPGFPTDLQQPLTAFLAVGNVKAKIIENIYHNRFTHVEELKRMGANIEVNENSLSINGVDKLIAKDVNGHDLRGGASLVIACLQAEGISTLRGLKYINRGYESMVSKLKKVGAHIEVIKENEK